MQTTKENPECQTTISGCLHYQFKPNNKDTVLLFKRNISDLVLKGKVIEKTSEGFIFDSDKRGETDTPPKLYKFEDIQYILGAYGNLIYGSFPDTLNFGKLDFNLTVARLDSSIIKPFPVSFVLQANENFSICIEPGKYKVREIVIPRFRHYSIDLPEITFEVEKDKNNYLGDIYFDSLTSGTNVELIKFEYKKPIGKRRSKKSIYESNLPWGFKLQTWLDDNFLGYHSILVKDEMKEQASRKSSLLKIIERDK